MPHLVLSCPFNYARLYITLEKWDKGETVRSCASLTTGMSVLPVLYQLLPAGSSAASKCPRLSLTRFSFSVSSSEHTSGVAYTRLKCTLVASLSPCSPPPPSANFPRTRQSSHGKYSSKPPPVGFGNTPSGSSMFFSSPRR